MAIPIFEKIPAVRKYREDVEKLTQTYSKTRDASIRAFYDTSILDKTLENPSFRSQPLLRRLKLKKLASFMTYSIANENYRKDRDFIGEYFPFSDLSNLVRLYKEKRIRPPGNTLQAVYHLIDVYVSPKKESRYNLHHILPGFMTHALDAVIELDLTPQFDVQRIDNLIRRAHVVGDQGAADAFQVIKDKILIVKNADMQAKISANQETSSF
ncbi:MAG: hypothetical protein V3U72_03705 [Candidatus Aenigmarchaeota archaeon]